MYRFFYYPKKAGTSAIKYTTQWCCISSPNSFSDKVTGLLPNTEYCFAAEAKNSAGTLAGGELNFTTAKGQSFRFIHMTDLHIGRMGCEERYDAAIKEILTLKPRPDFVLNTGDVVEYAWEVYWDGPLLLPNIFPKVKDPGNFSKYIEATKELTDAGIKVYTVPGNHDRYIYVDGTVIAYLTNDLSLYDKYVGTREVSFTHKGLTFIGLDSGQDYEKGNLLTEAGQNQFFKGTGLEKSQVDKLASSGNPKVVFMHHPAKNTVDGWTILKNQTEFINACKNNSVELVLTGHTHDDLVLDGEGPNPGLGHYPLFIQTRSSTKDASLNVISNLVGCVIGDQVGYRIVDVDNGLAIPQETKLVGATQSITASIHSPGILQVYDSSGRHTGPESGDKIPNSFYHSAWTVTLEDGTKLETWPEKVIIFDPCDNYRYQVIGTEQGDYGLQITGDRGTFQANDIPTSPAAVHEYTVDWDGLSLGQEGVILQIDEDGDGTFERITATNGELSPCRAAITPVGWQVVSQRAVNSTEYEYNLRLKAMNPLACSIKNGVVRLVGVPNSMTIVSDRVTFSHMVPNQFALSDDTFTIKTSKAIDIFDQRMTWQICDCRQPKRSDFNLDWRVDWPDCAQFAATWLKIGSHRPEDLNVDNMVDFRDFGIFAKDWESKILPTDLNTDSAVDFMDYAVLSESWLRQDCVGPEWCNSVDLDHNGKVDMDDVMIFVQDWLTNTAW